MARSEDGVRTSRLATDLRRIRFVIPGLRRGRLSGLPVHLRLLSIPTYRDAIAFDYGAHDWLRRGLTPRCQSVLTDALIPAKSGLGASKLMDPSSSLRSGRDDDSLKSVPDFFRTLVMVATQRAQSIKMVQMVSVRLTAVIDFSGIK